MSRRHRGFPVSNEGWYNYFVMRFNKTLDDDAALLAMFYLFCHLRDQDER